LGERLGLSSGGLHPVRRRCDDRNLARAIQRRSASFELGLPHPERIPIDPQPKISNHLKGRNKSGKRWRNFGATKAVACDDVESVLKPYFIWGDKKVRFWDQDARCACAKQLGVDEHDYCDGYY